jgi:hypothetical protein
MIGVMRFDGKIYARHWSACLKLTFCGVLSIGFCVAYWPIGLLLILVFSRAVVLVALNKIWHVQVDDGFVVWDPLCPWVARKSVPIANISSVRLNLDDPFTVRLRLKGRRPTYARIHISGQINAEEFVAAILAEGPDILLFRGYWGPSP